MAYKQTPGRSPFLKTGRGIPLNMISPLHDGTTHPHKGHKEEDTPPSVGKEEDTPPSVTTETLNITNTGSKESSSNLPTNNLENYQKGLIKDIPSQGIEDTERANKIVADKKALDIKNQAINESSGIESSKNISSGSTTVNVSDKTDEDLVKEAEVEKRNIENTAEGYNLLSNQYAIADSSATAQGSLSNLPMYQQLKGSPQYKQAEILGTGAAYLQRVGSGGFSPKQAIVKSGQSKMNIRSGIESLISGGDKRVTAAGNLNIDTATPTEIQNMISAGKKGRKNISYGNKTSVNPLTGRNLNELLTKSKFNTILSDAYFNKPNNGEN